MKAIRSHKKGVKKISTSSPAVSIDSPVKDPKRRLRQILRWIGWGIVYIFVFYLGNLSGEYIAAHMPLYSWYLPKVSLKTGQLQSFIPTIQMPSISMPSSPFEWSQLRTFFTSLRMPSVKFPSVSVSLNTSKLSQENTVTQAPSNATQASTKTVIIDGQVFAVPQEGASDSEKSQFYAKIDSLSREESTIGVSQLCAITPPFIKVKKGVVLTYRNDSQKEHMMVSNTRQFTLTASKTVQDTIEETTGVYSVFCDGTLAGYYISK